MLFALQTVRKNVFKFGNICIKILASLEKVEEDGIAVAGALKGPGLPISLPLSALTFLY